MNKRVKMEDMYNLFSEMLDNDGEVTFTVSGFSMQPMIYNQRDTVTIVKPSFPLKKYDIPLFRMDNGKFVLHRVVKVYKNDLYMCQGDNCWICESPIRDDQIIGIVKSFNRNGKRIDVDKSLGYWLYTRTWKFFHPFKPLYRMPQRVIAKIKKLYESTIKP